MYTAYQYNYKLPNLRHEVSWIVNNHIFPCDFFPYTHFMEPHEPYTNYPKYCLECGFVHDVHVKRRTVANMKTMYPLLKTGNIMYILLNCKNVLTISS